MRGKAINWDCLLGAAVVFLFAGLSLAWPDHFKKLEKVLYDAEYRISVGEPDEAPAVALIEIDDKSLSELGPWPWPRGRIVEMIELLGRNNVRVIGIDFPLHFEEYGPSIALLQDFHEKLKTQPSGKGTNGAPDWVLTDLEQMIEGLNNDDRLAESIAQNGKVILGYGILPFRSKSSLLTGLPSHERLVMGTNPASTHLREIQGTLSLPLPVLTNAAKGLGHLHLTSDANLINRSHPPLLLYDGAALPSYPLRLAMAFHNVDPSLIRTTPSGITWENPLLPLLNGEMLISFRRDQQVFPHFSFTDVLKAKSPPLALKGKVVLIGINDRYGPDGFDTPFLSSTISRSEFAANVLDSILNNRYITRPNIVSYFELLALLIIGGTATILFSRLREPRKLGVLAALITFTVLVGTLSLSVVGIWFKTAAIVSCLLVMYVFMLIRQLSALSAITEASDSAHRLLGIEFQKQGLLDLAFEKFQACPLDTKTKELLYKLGLEYEERRMPRKALIVYKFIRRAGGFRDLEEKMVRLQTAPEFPMFDTQGARKRGGILSDSFLQARKKVGRYQILEEMGKGTMGLVYKAMDPKINRLLAIKIIRFSDDFDADMIHEIKQRFFREAEIAGQLSHPSIVTIYDVGEDQDLTYIAMEYLEGENLSHYCKKGNLLPIERVLDVLASVAEALDYAHQANVIHRDIKPANIMLLKNGGVRVTDFGIAKAVSGSKTKTGVILGTPNYMSPEQIMGHKIDFRTDIFSLGVLFYHLLSGELPFRGDNLSKLLHQITQGKPSSLRKDNPRIPKACEQIIAKALAKKPDDRFRSAGEMARYLRIFISKITQSRKIKSTPETVHSGA